MEEGGDGGWVEFSFGFFVTRVVVVLVVVTCCFFAPARLIEKQGGESQEAAIQMFKGKEKADVCIILGIKTEYEPYDARLAAKMSSLHATIESLNLELANTRRNAARVAAGEFEREWQEQSRVAEGVLDEGAESAKRDGEGSRLLGEGGLGFEGRDGEVQRAWERGMEGLVRLKAGLGETMRRAEEAKRTVEYLEGRS